MSRFLLPTAMLADAVVLGCAEKREPTAPVSGALCLPCWHGIALKRVF